MSQYLSGRLLTVKLSRGYNLNVCLKDPLIGGGDTLGGDKDPRGGGDLRVIRKKIWRVLK